VSGHRSDHQKHPDKIPKKVKAARKKQEEKEVSTAAAAVESKGEDIILGTVEWDDVAPVSVDIKQGYHEIPIEEEYEFFSDCKNSENKSEEDDNESIYGDDNSNDDVVKIKSNKNEVQRCKWGRSPARSRTASHSRLRI
jgi:hypothetical protein